MRTFQKKIWQRSKKLKRKKRSKSLELKLQLRLNLQLALHHFLINLSETISPKKESIKSQAIMMVSLKEQINSIGLGKIDQIGQRDKIDRIDRIGKINSMINRKSITMRIRIMDLRLKEMQKLKGK